MAGMNCTFPPAEIEIYKQLSVRYKVQLTMLWVQIIIFLGTIFILYVAAFQFKFNIANIVSNFITILAISILFEKNKQIQQLPYWRCFFKNIQSQRVGGIGQFLHQEKNIVPKFQWIDLQLSDGG